MSVQPNQKRIRDYLKQQFDLPSEQIDVMIPDFITTLSGHLLHLEEVSATRESGEIGRAGHTIKGALLNLGLHECAEIAYEIEKKGKAGDNSADFQGLVTRLREELSVYLD